MSVIVVSGATHRSGFLDELESQLLAAHVPFHLQQVEPMPDGPNSMTMRRKAEFVKSMALKFSSYKTIYIVDAYDVLFYGSYQDLEEKDPLFIFAAERNAYPESNVEPSGSTPWRYCNAGCMAGSPIEMLAWSEAVLGMENLDILDQQWLNRHLNTNLCPIDHDTDLFYVVSAELEDGALQVKNGRPWNSHSDTYPNFLHFSGKCPDQEFRRMLENSD